MVDKRLLQHWQRELAAREQVRAALPPSWRADRRPEMETVRETYVEAMTAIRRADLHLVPED